MKSVNGNMIWSQALPGSLNVTSYIGTHGVRAQMKEVDAYLSLIRARITRIKDDAFRYTMGRGWSIIIRIFPSKDIYVQFFG